MLTAFIFPGQGSQSIGMGRDLYESDTTAAKLMDCANNLLGYSLTEIMFEGPEETLTQTKYTQPAIFLHSIARYNTIDSQPDMAAGHSLGELSALVAAEVINFEQGLKLVSIRGELMQNAGESLEGTMAAIIGLDDDVVESIVNEASLATQKPVVAANYNSPGQLVISGDPEAVDKAVEIAKEKGCRLAKKLSVSGAFHSPLMEEAYKGFGESLASIDFKTPQFPIYCNVTAEATTDPDKIKDNLLEQLLNPVRWTQTLKAMNEAGAKRFIEIGPGKVLQGLVKRTLTDVEFSGHQ